MTYSMYKDQSMCSMMDYDQSLECPVCKDEFEHPKLLPCYHTYCLKCLTKYCFEAVDGDTKPCPVCSRKFFIPKGGVENIPDNQFMMRRILKKTYSKEERKYKCEFCPEIGDNCEADAFCSECRQYLCGRCMRIHLVSAKSHTLIGIDEMPSIEEVLRLPSRNCPLHIKEIVFYCCECKTPLCHLCQFENHRKHICKLLSDVVKEKKEAFDCYGSKLRICYEEGTCRLMYLQKQREKTLLEVSAATQHLEEAFNNIIALIASRKTQLLKNIQNIKINKLNEIDSEEDFDQMHLSQISSFLAYSRLVMETGADCEIIRVADELHKRAEELIKSQDERNKQQLPHYGIKFVPSPDLKPQEVERFIGKISEKEEQICPPIPPLLVPTKPIGLQLPGGIKGLAVLNDQMFLVSDDRLQISVYDVNTSKVVCQIVVPDMKSPDGLAFCSHSKALYISDGQKDCIHKVSLDHDKMNLWKLNKKCEPSGLSVTAEHNLLVTVHIRGNAEAAIFEYSSEGLLLRDIKLDKCITEAWQTVQLSRDQFIVCHGSDSSLHRICLINSKGKIIKRYGGKNGRHKGLLNSPISLAIDNNKDHIFVADNGNNRVLMFNTDLKFLCQVQTDSELSKPSCLYFDSSSDRLFIGEWTGRVVIVCSPDQSLKEYSVELLASSTPGSERSERQLYKTTDVGKVYDKSESDPPDTSMKKNFNRSDLLKALDKYRSSSFDVVDARINATMNLVKIRCCVKQDSFCSPEDLIQFREYLENYRGNYKLEIGLIAQIPKCELTSSIGPGTGLAYRSDDDGWQVRLRLNRSIGAFVNVSDLGDHILTAGHNLTINTEIWSCLDTPIELQNRGCLGKVVAKCVTSETSEEMDTIDAALIKISDSLSFDYFKQTVTHGSSEKGISSLTGQCNVGDTIVRIYNDRNAVIRGTVIELDSNRFWEPQYRGCLEIENSDSNHDFHTEGQSGVLVAREPNDPVANRLMPVAMLTAKCQENNRSFSVAVPIDRTLDGLSHHPYAEGKHLEIIQSEGGEIGETNNLEEEQSGDLDENQNITDSDVIQNGGAMQHEIRISHQPRLHLFSENVGLLNAILIAIISFICGLVLNNFLR